ncbi:nucleoside 2-deoxyribosyltransferase [Cohaesibacter celericrescens]|uniref:Sugar kinase n=1 Tax=Cohaesibacter celericrescens TaxID=2067669 RepID=A0A2N5XMQ2_9HYPH|nr:nucleoside 2-deoxyribosyltransferase [Cohaesibacter celericrescens]PLW75762.1 sugar kinase [Cohaesibacter celericrescens]
MLPLLLVGEIIVDFTAARPGAECKLRLGGIVHAARGLWASSIDYAVAAVCPHYVVDQAKRYLNAHGCHEFVWLGEVTGSPGVMVIIDPTEVADQGYEDLLRGEKEITINEVGKSLDAYREVLIFPGGFDLAQLRSIFSSQARFSFDIAYDTEDLSVLAPFVGNINVIVISTSSPLFMRVGSENIDSMLPLIEKLGADVFLLKENRGGSRLFNLSNSSVEAIPAQLSVTVNSVGVGDVYTAVMVGLSGSSWEDAAWRGASAATAYSQTTYPDDFKRDLERSFRLSIDELRDLGGTILPWHTRRQTSIYLAAPDFSYIDKPEIDRTIEALRYHNFNVRRPIEENGELPLDSSDAVLRQTFSKDLRILDECAAVFAVPLGRDPGTLVEMGYAVARKLPVITFDPRSENHNTMVVGGSVCYSDNLDQCLNGLFEAVSKLWMAQQ